MGYKTKPLLTLMRRLTKAPYGSFLMNNRIFFQCYDVNIDSDIGMHYMLHIPDEYEDDIFDMTLMIKPDEILKAYKEGKDTIGAYNDKLAEDGKTKFKPKEISEEYFVEKTKTDDAKITFEFSLPDGHIHRTEPIVVDGPNIYNRMEIDNIEDTLQALTNRIRSGGFCVSYDGLSLGLTERILESGEVYDFIAKPHGKKIRIPFTKDKLLGMKNLDEFMFTLQETHIDHVYMLAIKLTKDDISEELWGYLLDY